MVAAFHHLFRLSNTKSGKSSVGNRQHLGWRIRHQPIHIAGHLWWWSVWMCWYGHISENPIFDHIDKPSALLSLEGVSHEESWSFYPNAVRTAGFCGNPSFHLYWPNKNQDRTHNILATRELIVQPGYILQFKVKEKKRLKLAYRSFYCMDSWS